MDGANCNVSHSLASNEVESVTINSPGRYREKTFWTRHVVVGRRGQISLVKSWSGGLGYTNAKTARRALKFSPYRLCPLLQVECDKRARQFENGAGNYRDLLHQFARAVLAIDHDRLFKELLTTFFVEFLELFFPKLVLTCNNTILY